MTHGMRDASTIDWGALRSPFNPNDVDFRIQSTFEQSGKTKAIAIAYMDARLVQNRLDEIVGPENWSFDWTPLITKNDNVTVAKGTLTIFGIPKSDVGDAGPTEPTKSTVSDALKRAAVMWGIGRYLYDLGTSFCETEQRGRSPAIPDAELKRMRASLPKPKSTGTMTEEVQATPTPPRYENGESTQEAAQTTAPAMTLPQLQARVTALCEQFAIDPTVIKHWRECIGLKADIKGMATLVGYLEDKDSRARPSLYSWGIKNLITPDNLDYIFATTLQHKEPGVSSWLEFWTKVQINPDDWAEKLIGLARELTPQPAA